jgi:dsRNA-specific ribonuclease
MLKYEIIKESGEPHNRVFEARVVMDGDIVLGYGKGKSHLDAEMAAAKAALQKLAVK